MSFLTSLAAVCYLHSTASEGEGLSEGLYSAFGLRMEDYWSVNNFFYRRWQFRQLHVRPLLVVDLALTPRTSVFYVFVDIAHSFRPP